MEGDVVHLERPWSDTADRVRSYASWFYHDDSTAEAHSRSRLRRDRFRWTRRLIWRDFRIRAYALPPYCCSTLAVAYDVFFPRKHPSDFPSMSHRFPRTPYL